MLSATFTTIQDSITECKKERERRSPRASRYTESNSEEQPKTQNVETQHPEYPQETKNSSQQTEHVFSSKESEEISPLLEKYSELLLKKFEEKINYN